MNAAPGLLLQLELVQLRVHHLAGVSPALSGGWIPPLVDLQLCKKGEAVRSSRAGLGGAAWTAQGAPSTLLESPLVDLQLCEGWGGFENDGGDWRPGQQQQSTDPRGQPLNQR